MNVNSGTDVSRVALQAENSSKTLQTKFLSWCRDYLSMNYFHRYSSLKAATVSVCCNMDNKCILYCIVFHWALGLDYQQ